MKQCQHCNKHPATQCRGLCSMCYKDLAIRNLCPPGELKWMNETEEDLDRLIAEQRKNLPKWWDHSSECSRVKNGGPKKKRKSRKKVKQT